jgi:hypothetical protein
MSAKYNLVCEQATTFNFQFQVLDNTTSGSTPWNLTSYTATMTVRPFLGSTTTTVVASTTNGRIVLDALNGRITVTIDAATTEDFSAGRYVYDLVVTTGATTTRLLEGKFTVTAGVTL